MSFFTELKRRNVLRVSILYVVLSWLILQIADVSISLLSLPEWTGKLVFTLVALGFIPTLVFSWLYELTPDGLKREHEVDRSKSITSETARKIDAIILVFGVLAIVAIVVDRLVPEESAPAPAAETKPAIADDKSIAVLPFANMSGDESQEFFSDGISEELLNVLAQIPGLRVAARTSSFQFKGQNSDIGVIARNLGVAHVLEGSVRKSGDRLRITAQLIKADDGFHMWSQTYDRELTDIFEIQDEIAKAVAGELQSQLGLNATDKQVTQPHVYKAANPQAYEAYLHGRQLINRRGKDNLEEAVVYLERSLRLDSNFAPTHAQLAIATALLLRGPSTYGDLSLAEVNDRATPHIRRAIELAPGLAEAHGARALVASIDSRYDEAIEHAQKAVEINPSYIDARNWLVNAQFNIGRHSEAILGREELYRLDPQSVIGRLNLVGTYYDTGRSDQGYALAMKLMDTHPWAAHISLASAYVESTGELGKGIRHGLQAFALEPEDQLGNSILVSGIGWIGLTDEARRIADSTAYEANFSTGNYERAAEIARHNSGRDPENNEHRFQLGAALSRQGGHEEELLELYEGLLRAIAPQTLLLEPLPDAPLPMARLAWLRSESGDADGATEAMLATEADLAERRKAGIAAFSMPVVEAMLAAVRADEAEVIRALRQAINLGWRDRGVFDEPMFAELEGSREFDAIQNDLDRILAKERAEALRMICHDNPVPHAWQPLAATCEGI